MLMFQNALMYNNHEHDVYKMAVEMQKDVMDQVAVGCWLSWLTFSIAVAVSGTRLAYVLQA